MYLSIVLVNLPLKKSTRSLLSSTTLLPTTFLSGSSTDRRISTLVSTSRLSPTTFRLPSVRISTTWRRCGMFLVLSESQSGNRCGVISASGFPLLRSFFSSKWTCFWFSSNLVLTVVIVTTGVSVSVVSILRPPAVTVRCWVLSPRSKCDNYTIFLYYHIRSNTNGLLVWNNSVCFVWAKHTKSIPCIKTEIDGQFIFLHILIIKPYSTQFAVSKDLFS